MFDLVNPGTLAATLAAPLIFLLPGWALLSLNLPPERFGEEPGAHPDVVSWLVLAVGLSLAVTPVALLYLDLVRLKAGVGAVLAVLGLSVIVIVWRRWPFSRGQMWWARWRRLRSWREKVSVVDAPLLVLALVMVLIVGVRLWVVRGINVGFWGDSYQHTMMSQLLLDNGGLFDSWEPYAPLETFTYHFGFHGNVALFQWATGWLTGNTTPRTVVLVGQFLNGLAALALYPLAVRLSAGRKWVGVGAVFIAGLLTPMPMFYVNWGRYTQLAGQVILPVAIWFTMEALEARRRDFRRLALAALAVAGLGLTHYFVLAFFVLFMIPYLGAWLSRRWRQWRLWGEGLLRIGIVGALALLLVLPWAIRILEGLLPRILAGWIQGAQSADFVKTENMFYPLADYVPTYLVVLAGLGGLWALVRRRQPAVLLLWVGCLFLLSNPHWLGLPGTGVVSNFTVELALYMPAAMLSAYLVGSVVSACESARHHLGRARPALAFVAAALLVAAAWLGVRQRKAVIDVRYQLVTPADEEALAWVGRNTPEDARFLVNSFFAYGGSLIVGSDAGWWLPLLAERENTVPPLNYGSEAGPAPDYAEQINDRAQTLEQYALDDPATVRYLEEGGISYVFIGERGGPLLDPALLLASPYYRLVYSHNPAGNRGPLVFEVIQP